MKNGKVQEIIEKWGRESEHTTDMLLDIKSEFGYLPGETLIQISAEVDVPLSEMYNIIDSNDALNLSPNGHHPKRRKSKYRYVVPGWEKPW